MDKRIKITLIAGSSALAAALLIAGAATYFPAKRKARDYADIVGPAFFASTPVGDRSAWFVHGPVSEIEIDGKRTAFDEDGRLSPQGDLVRLYDADGRFDGFEIEGSDGRVICEYDKDNLLISKVEDFDFSKGTYKYEYDGDGNLVSETVTLEEGDSLSVSMTRRFVIIAVDACKNWTARRTPEGTLERRSITYENDPHLERSLTPEVDRLTYSLIRRDNSPAAIRSLGARYLSIYETFGKNETSLEKALPLLERAAGEGDAHALYLLARCAETGTGRDKDPDRAASLYEEAAGKGSLPGAVLTADRYFNAKDYVHALPFLEQAADGGDAISSLRLADIYKDGQGVSKDQAEALLNYKTAASDGNLLAMNRLGNSYQYGRGCEPDSLSAFRAFRTAAMFGQVNAQFNLGDCYRKGIGVPVDRYLARIWYTRAADAGSASAKDALAEMEQEDLDLDQIDNPDMDEEKGPSVDYKEYFNF